MRVPYRPLTEKQYLELIKSSPVILTTGSGLKDINIFQKKQRGQNLNYGNGFVSSIIAKYGPKILPLLKKYLFPAAKEFGKDVLGDVVSGKSSLRKSLKKRGLQSLGNVAKKVVSGKGRGGKVVKRKRARYVLRKKKSRSSSRKGKKRNKTAVKVKKGGKRVQRKRKSRGKKSKGITRKTRSLRRTIKKKHCNKATRKNCPKDIFSL